MKKINIINLKRSAKRRKDMIKNCENNKIPFNIFPKVL